MKKYHNNVVSIMTDCEICGQVTTKRNYREGVYLCHECNDFYNPERIAKIRYMLENSNGNLNEEELEKFLEQLYMDIDIDK